MWAELQRADGDLRAAVRGSRPGTVAGETTAENPLCGETWQYMGTEVIRQPWQARPGALVHVFRHRAHPVDGDRHYVRIVATEGYTIPCTRHREGDACPLCRQDPVERARVIEAEKARGGRVAQRPPVTVDEQRIAPSEPVPAYAPAGSRYRNPESEE